MLRFAEIFLVLAPFAAFVAWRLLDWGNGPTPTMLVAAAGAVVLIAAALVWLASYDTLAPGEDYVPARLQNGRVIPGHAGRP